MLHGSGDQVACFADDLSWGPVSSIDERTAWLDAECPIPFGWDWLGDTYDQFWKAAGQDADDRLVWLSSNSPAELAGYLAYLERFSDRPAKVVRPNDHLPPHPTCGPLMGTGSANADQLADVLAHADRRPLDEDRGLFGRWVELRTENGLLRVLDGDRLVSAPVDTYDRLLLDAATGEWQRGVMVVGNALSASFDEQVRVSSDFLFARLAALVCSGVLEAEGSVLGWQPDGRREPAMVRRIS